MGKDFLVLYKMYFESAIHKTEVEVYENKL